MQKHKVRLRISAYSPYEEENIFRTIEGYTDMDMSDREELYYTLDLLDKHGSGGLDMYDHDNAGVRTLCAAMEAGVSDDIDDVICNIMNDHYYMTGTKTLLEEAKYLLMCDKYWGTEENPGIFTPQELAEKLKSDSTYHATSLGVLRTI